MDFTYENNYAYAGKTAIIYKFIAQGIIGGDKSFIEIGVEYKPSSETSWNKGIIISNANGITLDDLNLLTGKYDEEGATLPSKFRTNTPRMAIFSVINGLTYNTIYDVRGYYTDDSNKTTSFNQVSVTTFNTKPDSYTYDGCIYEKTVEDQQNIEEIKETVNTVIIPYIEKTCKMIDNFISAEAKQSIHFYYANDGSAAQAGGSIGSQIDVNLSAELDEDYEEIRSVLIHEFGHLYYSYRSSKMTKIMEFATDMPKARVRWLGEHCYPCISSARYSYVDDCINLLVYEYCHIDDE